MYLIQWFWSKTWEMQNSEPIKKANDSILSLWCYAKTFTSFST